MENTNKLLELQKRLKPIVKGESAKAGSFSYKYFDINSLLHEVMPHAQELGLTITQPIKFEEGRNVLHTLIQEDKTILAESSMALIELTDPQKMGGVITYFRRYALQSLLGLEAEDDDGASASQTDTRSAADKPKINPLQVHPDGKQVNIHVEDIYKGKTKDGDPFLSLKTEKGKVMVWQNSGYLNEFAIGVAYDVDIKKGAVTKVYGNVADDFADGVDDMMRGY